MGLENITENLNNIVDICESTNKTLEAASNLEPIVEVSAKAALPKSLNPPDPIPTKEKIRQAIFALLTGQASEILSINGKPIPTMKCNDALQTENYYNAPYGTIYSIAQHLTTKEKITEYKTKGIETKLTPTQDLITNLPKYNSTTKEQENVKLISTPEGGIKSTEIEEKSTQTVFPHNYMDDPALQSLINSLVVTISNSVAEAVTKVIMSKIEDNQTTIEIEWDPAMNHQIQLVNLPQAQYNGVGTVSPASVSTVGPLVATGLGTVSFKSGVRYKHKCRIQFGGNKPL